jgi:hypothetical protein
MKNHRRHLQVFSATEFYPDAFNSPPPVLGFQLRAYTLSHSISTFFDGLFQMGSHELFALGWLPTTILLISDYLIDRTTGVSHQHPSDPYPSYIG